MDYNAGLVLNASGKIGVLVSFYITTIKMFDFEIAVFDFVIFKNKKVFKNFMR